MSFRTTFAHLLYGFEISGVDGDEPYYPVDDLACKVVAVGERFNNTEHYFLTAVHLDAELSIIAGNEVKQLDLEALAGQIAQAKDRLQRFCEKNRIKFCEPRWHLTASTF